MKMTLRKPTTLCSKLSNDTKNDDYFILPHCPTRDFPTLIAQSRDFCENCNVKGKSPQNQKRYIAFWVGPRKAYKGLFWCENVQKL